MNKYFITKDFVMRYDKCVDNISVPKLYTFEILRCFNNPGIEISKDGKMFRRFKFGYVPELGNPTLIPQPWVSEVPIEIKDIYEFENDENALLFWEVKD